MLFTRLLNHTFTPMATRLLRVSILAPCTLQATLDARLDAVEELIQTEEKYTSIKEALRSLKRIDVDKLITAVSSSNASYVENRDVEVVSVAHDIRVQGCQYSPGRCCSGLSSFKSSQCRSVPACPTPCRSRLPVTSHEIDRKYGI